jgi:hypothetical protein
VVRAPRAVGERHSARRRAEQGLAPVLDAEGRGEARGPGGESERRQSDSDPALAFLRFRRRLGSHVVSDNYLQNLFGQDHQGSAALVSQFDVVPAGPPPFPFWHK